MLKEALNAVSRIHSRPAVLKRVGGAVDIYSPCRLTPSNFTRNQAGPEYTIIKGSEFVIPVDSMTGHFSQLLQFSREPWAGVFSLNLGGNNTSDIQYNASAAQIQSAIRLLPSMGNVLVSGDYVNGFSLVFPGMLTRPWVGFMNTSTLTDTFGVPVLATWRETDTPWDQPIRRGDRIVEPTRTWSVDEVSEMHDLGAEVMAWRVRTD